MPSHFQDTPFHSYSSYMRPLMSMSTSVMRRESPELVLLLVHFSLKKGEGEQTQKNASDREQWEREIDESLGGC
jgi:hypothetical protein